MSKKNHYVEILYAYTKHVAEMQLGERPVAVTFTGYDGFLYRNNVRMADGSKHEVRFPRSAFDSFVRTLKGSRDEDD